MRGGERGRDGKTSRNSDIPGLMEYEDPPPNSHFKMRYVVYSSKGLRTIITASPIER